MTDRLRLFVWDDYLTDYTSGLAVAVAHDATEARKMVQNAAGWEVGMGDPDVYELDRPRAFQTAGGG
jgi:hypothetical protein